MNLKKIKSILLSLVLGAIALRILVWAITPFLPYVVGALVLVTILGVILYRTTRF